MNIENTSSNADSVWSRTNIQELFKKTPASSNFSFNKASSTNNNLRGEKKKLLPLPDCFPEGMRNVLKSRNLEFSDLIEHNRSPQDVSSEEIKKKTKKQKVIQELLILIKN